MRLLLTWFGRVRLNIISHSISNSAIKFYLRIYLFDSYERAVKKAPSGMRDNLLTVVGGQEWQWRNCGREKLTLKIRNMNLVPHLCNELNKKRHWLLTTSGPSMPALDTVAPNHWFDFVSICSFRSLKLLPVKSGMWH